MAKFRAVQSDIESQFATNAWTSNEIKTIPNNYEGLDVGDEFCRVEILPNSPNPTYGNAGVAGNIIVQIYTDTGRGITRAMQIADYLDDILSNKSLTNGTRTGVSSLAFLGTDSQNNTLFRADYFVRFFYV